MIARSLDDRHWWQGLELGLQWFVEVLSAQKTQNKGQWTVWSLNSFWMPKLRTAVSWSQPSSPRLHSFMFHDKKSCRKTPSSCCLQGIHFPYAESLPRLVQQPLRPLWGQAEPFPAVQVLAKLPEQPLLHLQLCLLISLTRGHGSQFPASCIMLHLPATAFGSKFCACES